MEKRLIDSSIRREDLVNSLLDEVAEAMREQRAAEQSRQEADAVRSNLMRWELLRRAMRALNPARRPPTA
jgi:hypothetical protein